MNLSTSCICTEEGENCVTACCWSGHGYSDW